MTRFKHLAEAMPSTLWLSINGANVNNSVEFALKSHDIELLNHRFVDGQGLFNAEVGDRVDSFDTWKVETNAGEGVIFHPLLLHRTVMPTSNVPRYSVDIRYSPSKMTRKHRTNWRFLMRRIWEGVKPVLGWTR